MSKHSWDESWSGVGEFIAERRRAAELTLRQLAEQAGVSNPYLSQIERGLRRPSAEVLKQLATALKVSAQTLYVRAGILDPTDLDADDHGPADVERAIETDSRLTDRQRRLLLELYASFTETPTEPPPTPMTPTPKTDDATAAS